MSKFTLKTLTPIILDDEQKEKLNYSNYEALLDDVMSSDSYCNVALTGGYGAGKSTILNTYEKVFIFPWQNRMVRNKSVFII